MIPWLFSSPFFLIYILAHMSHMHLASFSVAGALSVTNETDHQALLAIKDSILGDPFGFLNSWNTSVHFCSWEGVTCSPRHQRVTLLNMSSHRLVGSLSPFVGNLSFLRALDLNNNNFNGKLPEEIGRLFRLQRLSLANNSFQGPLPHTLSQCSELRSIYMGWNYLGGDFPAQFTDLTKLVILRVPANNFTGKIPPSLGNLSSLTWLSISTNNLSGSIPSELGRLKLEFFQVSVNYLSGEIPPSVYNMTSISSFAVAFNELTGSIPRNLGLTVFPRLKFVYLNGNQFSGSIPPSLGNASGLVQIDVSQNAITGTLPMNLGNLKQLQLVYFGANPLDVRLGDTNSFISSLSNCSNLGILWLPLCGLNGPIPSSISNLSTNLLSFRLDRNYLSGEIPQGIKNLINLERFVLDGNRITGSIPDSIGQLTKLQDIRMIYNNISGKIPSSLGNITFLSDLLLAGNMLNGSIPDSLGNCSNLRELVLSSNFLTGKIPPQVVGLPSLSVGLRLDRNLLEGSLPDEVGNLINLNLLEVSENKLSGEIPVNLGKCLLLESLYLSGNLFQGQIPSSFGKLKGIQALDLSRNNLSGQIPKFLGELPIMYLNLSFNNFQGEVPTHGVFGNISAFSVSGNSQLCGGIRALQLASCPAEDVSNRHSKRRLILILVISLVGFAVCLSGCVYATLYCTRRSKTETSAPQTSGDRYTRLSYKDLLEATDGFSAGKLIGEGNLGSVYKGVISSNVIAVKVLKLQKPGAVKSFLAECKALANIKHRNLVKFITSCSSIDYNNNEFKALIFEFMPNGNLESWLHFQPGPSDHSNHGSLTFIERLHIAIDVAAALVYLHHDCHTQVIHCDLKPSNVLLDNDLVAHVSDFGLSKTILTSTSGSAATQNSFLGVQGTVGYIAPEYGMGEEISTEGDVYSYGVLILEMFTGKRPTDQMFSGNLSLHSYVNEALPDQLLQVIDVRMKLMKEDDTRSEDMSRVEKCLEGFLRIGVKCSAETPRERMDIREVHKELVSIKGRFLSSEGN